MKWIARSTFDDQKNSILRNKLKSIVIRTWNFYVENWNHCYKFFKIKNVLSSTSNFFLYDHYRQVYQAHRNLKRRHEKTLLTKIKKKYKKKQSMIDIQRQLKKLSMTKQKTLQTIKYVFEKKIHVIDALFTFVTSSIEKKCQRRITTINALIALCKKQKNQNFRHRKANIKFKKNKFQFCHRRICRKRFRSNVKLHNVYFAWKTKIYQSLIVWKLSRVVTISKNIFIANIFVIILTINQSFVFIFDATWFWTTQCIYKIMSKWCIKHALDSSKIFMNDFFDDVLITLTQWFFCNIIKFFLYIIISFYQF